MGVCQLGGGWGLVGRYQVSRVRRQGGRGAHSGGIFRGVIGGVIGEAGVITGGFNWSVVFDGLIMGGGG